MQSRVVCKIADSRLHATICDEWRNLAVLKCYEKRMNKGKRTSKKGKFTQNTFHGNEKVMISIAQLICEGKDECKTLYASSLEIFHIHGLP